MTIVRHGEQNFATQTMWSLSSPSEREQIIMKRQLSMPVVHSDLLIKLQTLLRLFIHHRKMNDTGETMSTICGFKGRENVEYRVL